jgi:hypothetical protein
VTHSFDTSDPHSPFCFLLDSTFLKTTALCIEEYCKKKEGDVLVSTIEEWWEGHLATGTLGDWSEEMRPVVTYSEALRLAKLDEREGDLPDIVEMDWMNETSWIPEEVYTPWYNYQKGFQGTTLMRASFCWIFKLTRATRWRILARLQLVSFVTR